MIPLKSNVKFFDISKYKKRLEKLGKEVKDLKPVMKEISNDMESKSKMCFKKSQDPYGNKWEKLKHRKGKPLVDKGGLSRSISNSSGKDWAVVGTNKVYAKTHQFGMRKGYNGKKTVEIGAFTRKGNIAVKAHKRAISLPWGNIPARPFIGISKSSMNLYAKMIKKYLME